MKFVLALMVVGLSALPVIYSQSYMPSAQADARTERIEHVQTARAASFPVAPTTTATTVEPAPAAKPARAAAPVAKPAGVAAAPKVTAHPTPASAPSKATTQTKASTPSPKPVATASVSSSFAEEVEREIIKLVNAERTAKGLSALAADTKLAAIGRAHSKDMLNNDYFSHTNLSGCSSSCRVTAAGYAWQATGENIFTMSGYDLSAKETARYMVEGWMDSPGHLANILNSTYTNHGVGLAISGKTIYATSLFSNPL